MKMAASTENGNGNHSSEDAPCTAGCSCSRYPLSFHNDVKDAFELISGEQNWHRTGADVFDKISFWNNTRSLFELIHKEVTKLSLAYTAEQKPLCEFSSQLFEGLRQCTLALVSTLYKIHNSSQGSLLVKLWHNLIHQTFLTLIQYSTAILAGDEDRLRQETGHVWEICETGKTSSTDNKHCLISMLDETYALVSDALDELIQAKDSPFAENNPIELNGGNFIPSEFDLSLLNAGIGLVKTCKILLRKVTSSIRSKGLCEAEGQIADYDKIAEVISLTSEKVDNFSASLYSPIIRQEVLDTLPPLTIHLELLLLTFRETHVNAEVDSHWTSVMDNAVTHNNSKVLELLS